MTDRYVRSTDGSNADDGLSWANAELDGAGAAAADSPGDRIFFSQAHAESTAGAITWAIAGTLAQPSLLLCADDSAGPPTAVATTGTVTTTGLGHITLNGSFYLYGLTFNIGTGVVSPVVTLGGGNVNQRYERCTFTFVATGSGHFIQLGTSAADVKSEIIWKNCNASFTSILSGAALRVAATRFVWSGGALTAGSAIPNLLLILHVANQRAASVLIEGVDLSLMGSGKFLVDASFMASGQTVDFRNCKLGASVAVVVNSFGGPGPRVRVHNCDSGDTNYRLAEHCYEGIIVSETTIVMTGGASDGDTPLSWKMDSSTNAEYPSLILRSPEIFSERITSTGSAKTITVEFIHDTNVAAGQGAGTANAFQDDEVWLEVSYLGTSGTPLGLFVSDAKANVLATAADQGSSSVTWTTTGLTTPVKQALSVTFTPQEKGVAICAICIGKASKTIYVDPVATVT
jgi:hypothetical protein